MGRVQHADSQHRSHIHTCAPPERPDYTAQSHEGKHGLARCRHDSESMARMAAARNKVGKREKDIFGSERKARSPASAASKICSEIKTSMRNRPACGHESEPVRACRHLAMACVLHADPPGPLRGLAHTSQIQRWLAPCGQVQATERTCEKPELSSSRGMLPANLLVCDPSLSSFGSSSPPPEMLVASFEDEKLTLRVGTLADGGYRRYFLDSC